MQSGLRRPEWTQAWAHWAQVQSRELDWQHRVEMRRRVFVRAAHNGDKQLRDALFALVATAHSIGDAIKKRQADADGLADRDIEVLAENVLAVMCSVPAPHRAADDDLPF